jgi:hypothetical protein
MNMLVDVTKKIYDLEGKEVKLEREGLEPTDWSIGKAAAQALITPTQQTSNDAVVRFLLAMKLQTAEGEVELTLDEIIMVKTAASQVFGPLVAAQVILAFDPNAK